ncbi:hypothetical protein CQJ36_18695 [Salmonella enterica subsp. enterica serovar Montevideo]|nr:hypothetical protein [Salmonella enterica subsp. enterica serovar Montevideo]
MTDIAQLLGKDADSLLQHRCMTIPSDQLYLPGKDYVDRVMIDNNRLPAVLRNMQTLYNTGRLAGTGYLSILPVDQGVEHSAAFERAHELGMVTVLWAYLRNSSFKKDGVDYHVSADLTGQANHLAATIGADIVKQKMAENNGGYKAVNFGYTDDRVYSKLTSDNPIDLVRYQLANCYMGRAGLINSGGADGGDTDLGDAVRTAVINKRAGGMGLILGRKAFKKSMADGVKLINAVQDVYLDSKVTIA